VNLVDTFGGQISNSFQKRPEKQNKNEEKKGNFYASGVTLKHMIVYT